MSHEKGGKMDDKKYSTPFASSEHNDKIKTCNENLKPLLSRPDPRNDGVPSTSSLKRCSNHICH